MEGLKKHDRIKKNEMMPFAAKCMDLEIIRLSEVSQTEKDKCHMISLICGISKKIIWLQNRLTDIENKHGYQGGSWGCDKLGVWD